MRNGVLDTGKHLSPPSVLQLMGFDRRAHNLADWDLFLFHAPLAVLLTLWLRRKSLGGFSLSGPLKRLEISMWSMGGSWPW